MFGGPHGWDASRGRGCPLVFSLATCAPLQLEWEACAWVSRFLCFLANLKENSDGEKKSFPHFAPPLSQHHRLWHVSF